MTTTATAIQYRESAQFALKTATRMLKATDKWLNWCEGMHAVHVAAGMFDREDYNTETWRQDMIAQDRAYTAANKRPSMPSKSHKHRMYSEVYRLAALTGVDTSAGIRDLAGIRTVLAAAAAALAA